MYTISRLYSFIDFDKAVVHVSAYCNLIRCFSPNTRIFHFDMRKSKSKSKHRSFSKLPCLKLMYNDELGLSFYST